MSINQTRIPLEGMIGHLAYITFEEIEPTDAITTRLEGRIIYNPRRDCLHFLPKGSRRPFMGFPIAHIYGFELIRKDNETHAEQLELVTQNKHSRVYRTCIYPRNSQTKNKNSVRIQHCESNEDFIMLEVSGVLENKRSVQGYVEVPLNDWQFTGNILYAKKLTAAEEDRGFALGWETLSPQHELYRQVVSYLEVEFTEVI